MRRKGGVMKQQVKSALRDLESARKEILQIKDMLPENDPRRIDVDDVELGVDWIKQRLEKLEQASSLSAKHPESNGQNSAGAV